MSQKIPVPYYSQFVDIQDPFWILRACGGLCLAMVTEYYGKSHPDLLLLCNEAKERGGYHLSNGWVHEYIVTKAQELGLHAHRKEGLTTLDEIIASLVAGHPVIVSVEKRVLEQTRFHLIVLTGFEHSQTKADLADEAFEFANSQELNAKSCFYYHETESTNKEKGQFRKCDADTLMQYWRGKAIFITK
jgi:hypothetical protein